MKTQFLKQVGATLGGTFIFTLLFLAWPSASEANMPPPGGYNYKILDYTDRYYLGDGVWLRHDHCYHGPGLC
ncbi:hypothetical protein [Algoriphagus sp. NG3]|uniref:hypothetical protein n=1 Tax=Algoriphagus sp. NG3 TaxID=3097546 RepID=UPI002A807ADD|nr:hypothetical protein [Algoriphagus sp. NG3]WPR75655.1 hypothetical protein SLW71_23670 [Algoriphagus sp. NG3]